MSPLLPQFSSLVTDEGQQFITVFTGERLLPPVDDSHPNFEQIKDLMVLSLDGVEIDVQGLIDLFDVAETVAAKFQTVSERITVANGQIMLDGDVIENALTTQILRFMDEGVEDWRPLVAFFENVLANPNEHSREQLYSWLDKHEFTITEDGYIVGYKGVASDGKGGYQSISSGRETVLVNDVPHTGHIPNPVGGVVSMSRSLVHHDPSVGCSRGLHVGTYEYASGFSRTAVLEVHVNPRDVVSVPTDCNWQKVRTCRYEIVDLIEKKYDVSFLGFVDDSTGDEGVDIDLDNPTTYDHLDEGDRFSDEDGDEGIVLAVNADGVDVLYDSDRIGSRGLVTWAPHQMDLTKIAGANRFKAGDVLTNVNGVDGNIVITSVDGPEQYGMRFDDGSSGSFSLSADEGTLVNQAADDLRDAQGRFHKGRPGSKRDDRTGRFSA